MEDYLHLEKSMPRFFYFLRGVRRTIRLKKYRSMSLSDIMRRDAALFEKQIGRTLDWHNLRSYNEKLQWEKIFNQNSLKTRLADKYLVREWVADKIGEEYLVPLLGVWDDAKEIDFDKLPESFVLKTNCASGDVIIVKNKSELSAKDIVRIRCKLHFYLNYDWGYQTFERHYSDIRPRVIAEKLLPADDTDVPDYKFTCFDGKPFCCRVDIGRYHNHRRNTYDLQWKLQSWNAGLYNNTEYLFPKPRNFERMVELASVLAEGFPQVRIDFYNFEGKIYFGEVTFTSASGFEPIVPESMDYELGEKWHADCLVPSGY